jgi:hypothetical protein
MSRFAVIAGAVTGLVLVLALVAGALLGRHAAPGATPTQVVHVGPASLVVPADWHRVSSTKSAAIFKVSSRERAVVKLAPVRAPARSARAAMLAGYRAWREGAVSVLPTSAGLVTVDCAGCTDAIQAISVPGAAILDPARDFALALRAPDVVASLDRARVLGRAELRQATTPTDQSRWASRLAAAHQDAAAALRSVAGPDLLERLADVRAAYSDLAGAATAGSAADFDAARARISTAETKLTRSLGDIAPPPVQPRATASAPVLSHAVPRPLLALVIILFGGLGCGLALTKSGRRRAEPASAPDASASAPTSLAIPQAPAPEPAHAERAVRPAPAAPATRPATKQPVANGVHRRQAAERPMANGAEAERPMASAQAAERPAAQAHAAAERPVARAEATERPASRGAAERPVARAQATERPASRGRAAERPAANAPAAREEVPERPARRQAPQRRAPVLPPEVVNATWTCELTWSAGLRGSAFHATATAAGEQPVDLAQSPKLSWPPFLPPSPEAELVAAARTVARALVSAGWTPTTRGGSWYAQRFAWARDGAPPPLGTIRR